ncbi:hypothetical protein H2203_000784 [Taxawa tesnikishii (nom. ined.)]|nr:hypothetical protein H2203_000784 [Dothideales sp. JES 119]
MYALAILIELPHNTSHDTVESVTQRWAVISRAMDALHDATESVIYARLSLRVDTVLAVRPWVPTPAEMSAPRRSRQGRWGFHAQSISPSFAGALSAPPITKLKPWALRHDETIMRAAEGATARIMQGLSILIVSTGQDRWGIWRDEVRVSNQWTGGKPKGTLFPIVLTAALSNHLRSLEAFVPCRYKKRFARKVRKIASWNSPALNRTVILTPDCNVGRRLVFLLSAFLPSLGASSQIAGPELETFSHAPTRGILSSSFFESPGPSQPLMYQEPSQLSIGTPSLEAANVQPATLNSVRPSVSSRRPSSSRSIKMSECLVPFGTAESRKSSATTNSTVSTPAIPIAHTRKPMTPSGSPGDRPGSSGSASINLLQRLQRNNSANLSTSSDSQSASKWGSLTSTWSTRPRRESSFTERSYAGTHLGSGEDALRSILKSGRDSTGRKAGHKLVRMVDEAQAINMPDRAEPDPCDSAMRTRDATPNSSRAVSDGSPSASPPSRLLPLCSTSSSSDPPFRLDCKPGEGVIDVELPAAALLPSNLTQPNPLLPFQPTDAISVGEPTSPPSPPSSPFPSAKNDHFARAAGYLETFHPDFALQAIRPRPSIEAEIREAMRSEPSPRVPRSIVTSDVGPIERSVDVCSSVLVDIAKGSVKRVLLRRRIRLTKIENKATRPLSGGSLAGNGSMVGPPRGPQEHMQSGKGTLLAGPPYPGHLRSPSIPQPHVHPVTADPQKMMLLPKKC